MLRYFWYINKKSHFKLHLSETSFVEEYCHCIPPENISVSEVYYQNLSEAHNKIFEAILVRTNNSMYDAQHIDWDHLQKNECAM